VVNKCGDIMVVSLKEAVWIKDSKNLENWKGKMKSATNTHG
jgi:hypothetical protein